MQIFKRVFSKKNPSNVTKSIRITTPMLNALQKLAEDRGLSLNAYIVLRLDQMLQVELKRGNIKPAIFNEIELSGEK